MALTLVAPVLVVAACGGGSHSSSSIAAPAATEPATTAPSTTPTTAAAAPDPCALVSEADAQAVVQTPLQPALKAGQPPDVMCQYTSSPTGPTAQVEIFVGDGAKKGLDIDRDELKHDFTTLTGIGDEAYLEADNVFLRKGSVWVQVNVVDLDSPPGSGADRTADARQEDRHRVLSGRLVARAVEFNAVA